MDFVLFIVIAGIMLYNVLQVLKAGNGKRFEPMPILFFFAAFIDLYHLIKK